MNAHDHGDTAGLDSPVLVRPAGNRTGSATASSRSRARVGLVLAAVIGAGWSTRAFGGGENPQVPPGWEVIRVTDDAFYDGPPSINCLGQVVFHKEIDNEWDLAEIYLFDPAQGLIRVTEDDVHDWLPDINDSGTIAWSRWDGEGGTGEIVMWRDGELIRITENRCHEHGGPKLNNHNHLVWYQETNERCSARNILFYDGSDIHVIADDGFSHWGPFINDNDDIAWTRFDFCASPYEAEIMLYSSGETVQLTDDHLVRTGGDINNNRVVTWSSTDLGIETWEDGGRRIVASPGDGPHISNVGHIVFIKWHPESETYQSYMYWDGETIQLTNSDVYNVALSVNELSEIVLQTGWLPDLDILILRPTVQSADFDQNGVVVIPDYQVWLDQFRGPGARFLDCGGRRMDLNWDGSVDLADFAVLQVQYTGGP